MSNKQILIVDDNDIILNVMEQNIEMVHPEYQVVLAENGFIALNKLQNLSFDLVVTDYNMPGMDGLELAATIRKISPQTPIVLMSSDLCEAESRSKNKGLALDGYLQKPFRWKQFWPFLLA
jgi:two-component system, chemotaxis family, chemotaxis protein CheY